MTSRPLPTPTYACQLSAAVRVSFSARVVEGSPVERCPMVVVPEGPSATVITREEPAGPGLRTHQYPGVEALRTGNGALVEGAPAVQDPVGWRDVSAT